MTNKIITNIRTRFDHAAARKILKEQYEGNMIFHFAEGMWRAGPDLINILTAMTTDHIVLLDIYDTPIKVDRQELLSLTKEKWQEQMNDWEVEYAELNQLR